MPRAADRARRSAPEKCTDDLALFPFILCIFYLGIRLWTEFAFTVSPRSAAEGCARAGRRAWLRGRGCAAVLRPRPLLCVRGGATASLRPAAEVGAGGGWPQPPSCWLCAAGTSRLTLPISTAYPCCTNRLSQGQTLQTRKEKKEAEGAQERFRVPSPYKIGLCVRVCLCVCICVRACMSLLHTTIGWSR